MKNESDAVVSSDQFHRPRRSKSREVSSRFLSPGSTSSFDSGIPSPNQALSPTHRKSRTNSAENTRKHRSQEGPGLIQGLWPSSTTSSSGRKLDTLADHLGNDRLKDHQVPKSNEKSSNSHSFSLSRQRSSSEFARLELPEKENTKENHRPVIGGSMRYPGKLQLPRKSASSSSKFSFPIVESGRLSVDENALYGKSSRRQSDSFKDTADLASECSDISYKTDLGSVSAKFSTRKSGGMEVSSKYMTDKPRRPQRAHSDSSIPNPVSVDGSSRSKNIIIKTVINRANSLTGYGSALSQWALSPGRTDSPPMSVESKERPMSFSSLKPMNSSSSKARGMEKLLNLGLDLFKSKKASVSCTSPMGPVTFENIHQLRLLHNRLMQWRFVNARADNVNGKLTESAEANLLSAWHGMTKLQHSVIQKKIQLQKEKLQMKLNFILISQLKSLESWGDMERQHMATLSKTKECIHSVVCRVPVIEGAKVDTQATAITLRHASDLLASIKMMLTLFSPSAMNSALLLSELAKVVVQEKLLLEECLELCRTISEFEVKERSIKGGMIQLISARQQQKLAAG